MLLITELAGVQRKFVAGGIKKENYIVKIILIILNFK